ncbi:sulfatase-like hydrolase/transferase [Arthrobacter crystallopoietes]|uniref:sulfatase family protein n=1 Tax=Crystallibacter crystallopoietes TaxID=37928 RepID=UPI003D1C73F2
MTGTVKRPNVLVFIADQLRADHLGFAGNTVVRTPNLDRLAAGSMVFTEATVTNPTCMPNRASLLTGRWPSAHGTRCNGITMDPDAGNMVKALSCGGYLTTAVGKLHHQNMGWDFEPVQRAEIQATNPLLLDPQAADARTRLRPAGWDKWEDSQAHNERFIPLPEDYYGYRHVDLVIGHGDRPGGHYVHWARERGLDPLAVGGAANATRRLDSWDQVYQSAIPAELHPSSYVGERAVEHLAEFASAEDPFFMFVSFPDPHHPFSPPDGYADLYSPDEVQMPIGFWQDHAKSPPHIQHMFEHRGEPNEDPTMTFAADETQFRQALAAQYGLITLMDEQIGRILAALEENRLAEDTIIIFTSDHGDLFGDHGLMLKHFSHYRAVTNVPLTIKVPGKPAGTSDALVSTADLAPTLLELTGTRHYRGIQGVSLVPLLEGEEASVRDALIIEEDQPFGLPGLPGSVRTRSVLTKGGRLTRYFGTDISELYDHVTDREELNNVTGEPKFKELQDALTAAMLEGMAALADQGIAPTASA